MNAQIATREEAGRPCPFCRFALKEGAAVVACPSCSATHHEDCWADNGGCAIMGCAAAPSPAAASALPPRPAVAPPQPAPGPQPAPAGAVPASPVHAQAPAAGQPSRGGRSGGLIAAVLVLALVIAGSAAAVVLTSSRGAKAAVAGPGPVTSRELGDDGGQTTATTPTPEATATPVETKTPEPTVTAAPPESPRAAIQNVLDEYYAAVEAGDFASAWALLSPTYKDWKAREDGGFPKWRLQETGNRKHLDPEGLRVSVRDVDETTGIATINVRGMHYTSGDVVDCDFEGVTWARRTSDGRWQYDQGYMQRADRRAIWRPRNTETLGFLCTPPY